LVEERSSGPKKRFMIITALISLLIPLIIVQIFIELFSKNLKFYWPLFLTVNAFGPIIGGSLLIMAIIAVVLFVHFYFDYYGFDKFNLVGKFKKIHYLDSRTKRNAVG